MNQSSLQITGFFFKVALSVTKMETMATPLPLVVPFSIWVHQSSMLWVKVSLEFRREEEYLRFPPTLNVFMSKHRTLWLK